jgi:hypothetical protein
MGYSKKDAEMAIEGDKGQGPNLMRRKQQK